MRRSTGPERFLATVLFVDIVGSTEIAARLGDRAWRDLLIEFYARVRRQLRRTSGQELDTAGDGLFAAFDSPASAIDCALVITREVAELDIAVRCGLHIGEVERVGRKVGGIAVHIGARVAAAAAPNEVLVTRTVRELATGHAVRFEDRGHQELKGVTEPWLLYAVIGERDARDGAEAVDAGAGAAPRPMRRPRRPFWVRHPRVTAGAALILVLVVVGTAYVFMSAPRVMSGVEPDSVALIDGGAGGVIGQVKVGSQPADLAFGDGSLWVTNTGSDTVTRIDPERLSAVDTVQVGAEPEGIAFGFDAVWVANSGSGTVSQINPGTNTVVRSIPTGNGPTDVAVAGDSVWAVNLLDGTLVRIAPDSGEVAATVQVGPNPSAIAADDRSIWIADRDGAAVTRVDAASGQAAESINVGSRPSALALSGNTLWVANSGDSTVSRIDVASGRVISTIVVPAQPSGVAVSGDAVWVATGLDGSISRIDPPSGSVQTIRTVSSPVRVAADQEGRIWFTARGSAASRRGGTLRVAYYLDSLSIEPALAWSSEEWGVILAAYDGLLSYRPTAGAGGAELVPNLAEAIPTPADGGTTWTFRLREGIRYSDGTELSPADFRHAIERGFEVAESPDEAPATVFYGGIAGAEACIEATGTDADCDLADGIEVDAGQRTVTFHLVEPDPDFLYKLAMPFASAVPSDTPGELLTEPVPGTGPYTITEYGESSIRLVRNPNFGVRSADARPDGFPDEIVWERAEDQDDAVDRVIAGDADVLAGRPPPDRDADLLTRYTSQVHVRPFGTLFAALDTTKPPFDDIRVRQAINYAVDRQRVAALLGGPGQASVTCQVVQPNSLGYRRFCPYTVDPNPAGVWTGPDRARAVELIAESGAAGAPVEIWVTDEPAVQILAGHLVEVLRGLGLEPSLQTVTVDEFLTEVYSTAPDREPIAAVSGWVTDYPAASGFIEPNFTCGSPTNVARLCDESLEERMQEARELQATDPVAAGEIWSELDRSITEAAAWVALVNYNETVFVSERVGNVQMHVQWGLLLDQLWVE